MGHRTYDFQDYQKTVRDASTSPTGFFKHTAQISSGEVRAGAHPLLEPSRPNKAGKITRESCDSAAHPNSVPVAVLFDVTGSMVSHPQMFVSKLGTLMTRLVETSIKHPHVLLGGVGDAYSDNAPLQLGQFEAGNELDTVLSQLYLERGGGGSGQESYELAMYFLSKYSELDSLTKRGKKGYLILIGDELPYDNVDPQVVKAVIGDDIPEPIPTGKILDELRKKFIVKWIFPAGTQYWDSARINDGLTKYFGKDLIRLEHPEYITEVITGLIAIGEGNALEPVLTTMTGSAAAAVKKALKDTPRKAAGLEALDLF